MRFPQLPLLILAACLGMNFIATASTADRIFLQHFIARHKGNDTLADPGDSKKGFRNLFVSNKIAEGITAEQLNPQATSFVQDYLKKHANGLQQMKGWGKPYFDMIDGVLTQYSLPKELKYLAVIESGLRPLTLSWAGALGPWQLMPATARQYGLKVNRQTDERTDYQKSTHVAAKLLRDLYKQYEDWLLVIAAYNGGPGNVNKAIRNSGSRDFWKLQHHLPEESKNHVKKFIATHYIMEGEGGITTLTKEEAKDALLNNSTLSKEETEQSKLLSITGRYNAAVICQHVEMTVADFNRYNPGFDKQVSIDGKYELRLPFEKMEIFLEKKNLILGESMQLLLKGTANR